MESMRGKWNMWDMSENIKGRDHFGDLVDGMILK
jgi:hypothetical protein